MKHPLAALMVAVLLATQACGRPDPVAENAEDGAILNAPETSGNAIPADPAPASPVNEPPTLNEAEDWGSENGPPPPVSSITFPDELRGRWALVPADCEPGRSDAKGLIQIGEQSVYFYESVARLKAHRASDANSFSGLFAFTGEGQEWEKVMTFSRVGDTLVRAEAEGRFTYKRCS